MRTVVCSAMSSMVPRNLEMMSRRDMPSAASLEEEEEGEEEELLEEELVSEPS
jgi:hypothetical protein